MIVAVSAGREMHLSEAQGPWQPDHRDQRRQSSPRGQRQAHSVIAHANRDHQAPIADDRAAVELLHQVGADRAELQD